MDNKKLVLVVDDDPDLVEAVALKLESENYGWPRPMTAWKRWIRSKKNDRRWSS